MVATLRKAHIKRCPGYVKESDGTFTKLPSVWVDVMRIDAVTVDVRGDDKMPKPFKHDKELPSPDTVDRQLTIFLKWDDAGSELEKHSNTRRMTNVLRATDPEGFVPEVFELVPNLFVPIKTITRLTVGESGVDTVLVFDNKNVDTNGDHIPTNRRHKVLRLYHHATTKDEELSETPFKIRDYKDYEIAGDPDKAQYIDFELIGSYPFKLHGDKQQYLIIFKHHDVYENMGIEINSDDVKSNGKNANGDDVIPARLDPFQQIINVSWGAATEIRQEAAVYQEECRVRDSNKLTISMWVRIPQEIFDKYDTVTVLEFGPKNEEHEGNPDEDDPEAVTHKLKMQGSRITVSKGGEVNATFASTLQTGTMIKCNNDDVELGQEAMKTNNVLILPAGLTQDEIDERTSDSVTFINLLRFGTIAAYDDKPPEGLLSVRIEYKFLVPPYPDGYDGPLAWVYEDTPAPGFEPVPGDPIPIQLYRGDLLVGNQFLPPAHLMTVIFHFFGKGDGTEASNKDVPYQIIADCKGEARGFLPDVWNHILVTADTSLPTHYIMHDSEPMTIESSPILTIAVNGKDFTNTTLRQTDSDGNPILIDVEPGTTLASVHAAESVHTDPTWEQTCSKGDGGAGNGAEHEKDITIPDFQIALEDKEFSFPVQRKSLLITEDNPTPQDEAIIEYCGFQLFIGMTAEANDPDKLAYFVKVPDEPPKQKPISANGIQMVPLIAARKRWGPPEYSLDGAPKDFMKNEDGTAGEFQPEGVVGEDIKEYTPRPPTGKMPDVT